MRNENNWIITILFIALVLMTWLAWRNAQPINCDREIYKEGLRICEVWDRN